MHIICDCYVIATLSILYFIYIVLAFTKCVKLVGTKTEFIWWLTLNQIFTDLEWKVIYVGSAESEEHDQVLDTIYVGPIPEGRHMFVFQVRITT
jgi:hypothetical protein